MSSSSSFILQPLVGGITSSVVFVLFWIIRDYFVVYPSSAIKNDAGEAWKWRNIYVSWIHAIICAILAVSSYFVHPELFYADLIDHVTPLTYLTVSFSVGYFLYDSVDIMMSRRTTEQWEVMIHHVLVLLMFILNMLTLQSIGINVVALLAEINTVCLHSRKLLHCCRVSRQSLLLRTVNVANVLTFIPFRLCNWFYISYWMVTEFHRLSTVFAICLVPSMLVLGAFQPVLFWRLLRNDFLTKRKSKDAKQEGQSLNNNDVKADGETRTRSSETRRKAKSVEVAG